MVIASTVLGNDIGALVYSLPNVKWVDNRVSLVYGRFSNGRIGTSRFNIAIFLFIGVILI